MSKRTKIIYNSLSIIMGIVVLYFVFKNIRQYNDWWLDKIGLWFGTDSFWIRSIIANILDIIAPIVIIAIISGVVAIIKKLKRR